MTADNTPLHIKYRPTSFAEVVGQDEVVRSLKGLLKGGSTPHSFLFIGPSGCGKTTLARILAKELKCEPSNIIEADAATKNGIDDVRSLTENLKYLGFGDKPNKMIMLDECHALSKPAWQSLLKAVEEPPPHVFFAFCTTESSKVPETIVTRCHSYNLKSVGRKVLMDLLAEVVDAEGLEVPDTFIAMAANAADGSPRKALVLLSLISSCSTEEEAAILLDKPTENKEIIDLCRLLVAGGLKWDHFVSTLRQMPDQNPESMRIVMVNYLAACLIRSKEKEVPRLLDLLNAFGTPFNPTDKMAPLLLAVGNLLFPG